MEPAKGIDLPKEPAKDNIPEAQENTTQNRQDPAPNHHNLGSSSKKDMPDNPHVSSDVTQVSFEQVHPSKTSVVPDHEVSTVRPVLPVGDIRMLTPHHPISMPDETLALPVPSSISNQTSITPSHSKGLKQTALSLRPQPSGQGRLLPSASSRPIATRSQIHTPIQSTTLKPSQPAQAPNFSSRSKEDKPHSSHKPSRP